MSISQLVMLIFAVDVYIPFVEGLKCAQCSSTRGPSTRTAECRSGSVQPNDCAGLYKGARFCVTYSGNIRRGRVVFRDCSYVDMQSICRSQLLENFETEVCYETCSTDGCNAVSVSNTCSTPRGAYGMILTLVCLAHLLKWR